MQTSDIPIFGKTKILPSGIVIGNHPSQYQKYCWFIEGIDTLHNEGEPAIEYKDGDKCWYQHDRRHRLDGPAVEYTDGRKSYYIDGICYSEEDYWKHPKVKEYLYLKEHPELESFI